VLDGQAAPGALAKQVLVFVRMRELASVHADLAKRLSEL